MLKKSMMFAAVCVFAFGLALTYADQSSAAGNGPEEMVLKTAEGKKPAKFPHKKHQGFLKCADCHHTKAADGKQGPYKAGEEKKCETCHNKDMANAELNNFKNAAHKNCKDCHAKAEKEGKPAPTKCTGCHVQ